MKQESINRHRWQESAADGLVSCVCHMGRNSIVNQFGGRGDQFSRYQKRVELALKQESINRHKWQESAADGLVGCMCGGEGRVGAHPGCDVKL